MKQIKHSYQTIVIVLLIVLAFGLIAAIYYHQSNRRYNSAEFKAYKQARLYCDNFFAGSSSNETNAELYRDMQRDQGIVGC